MAEELKIHISLCEQLLEIHRKSYASVVNGGILVDHFMSLEHGIRLIGSFYDPQKAYTTQRIWKLVSHVKQKLYSLSHLRINETLVKKLDGEYTELREQMKNVIKKPGTNKYSDPKKFSCTEYNYTNSLLQKIIEELMSSDYKADQRRPVMKELEHIRKILSLLEPFSKYFDYEKPRDKILRSVASRDEILETVASQDEILKTVASLMERVTCFVYLYAVWNMDGILVKSVKNILSDLRVEETQIMEMYLSLTVALDNLESHISMSLRLLGWSKRCYLGKEMGEALEDHFTSMEHGLQYLVKILKVSENEEFKLRVKEIISNMKQKLYSLPHSHNNDNPKVNLEHAYGELREEMKNVVINPRTKDCDILFPKVLASNQCLLLEEIVELTSLKLISNSKAAQTTPMMKEIKEFRKKLRSLKPLFDYARIKFDTSFLFTRESEVVEVNVALTAFLDKATCLIYLSLVGLTKDMFVSLENNFSLLIEETTRIKKISLDLGIMFADDFESDIDMSLSLIKGHQKSHTYSTRQKMHMGSGIKFDDEVESNIYVPLTFVKRHQESHILTPTEAMLEDHIISLKHGIEFLKWFFNVYNFDEHFKRCIISMAGSIKEKLELLTKQDDESLNMDVNGVCVVLREEMKNVIVSRRAKKYDSLFQETYLYDFQTEKTMKDYLRRNYDFLVEKITTLGTSNCKADRIAPLKKELQNLWKRLNIFKPLGLYICGITGWRDKKEIFTTLLTFHQEAAFLIYLTFVGTRDEKIEPSVRSSISIALAETDDVQEIYTIILSQFLSEGHYKVKELYLLENVMILLKSNDKSLNEGNWKLDKVLSDIHSFLLALPPNVILRKLHLLKDILHHSIPIVYSCYLELTEVDIPAEFKCVHDLIEHIKSEAMEMNLYYSLEVEDFGVLELLLIYLEDLRKNQEILLVEIGDLHFEVSTLLSLAKSICQEELDKNACRYIMNLAYQAEYIIDLYLVTSPEKRDSGLITSLSEIIQQLRIFREDARNFREDVNNLDLSDPGQYLLADDVAVDTSKQVRDNDGIVGLQEETQNIEVDLLRGEEKLNVVAITGMAGIGKTTLALTLYNSPETANHFDIRARCVVSQSYQRRALLISLLDQVNGSDEVSEMSDQGLADHFCRSLKQRRYLILLDDIWDTTLWNYLKQYLPKNLNGSRILITTRSMDVAGQIANKVIELHGLSEENSWELFAKKIPDLSDDLVNISKGIVKNCKGLPLLIVIVAGIFSSIERTMEKWNQIARNQLNSAVLRDAQGRCEATLQLSYNHLPNRLRYCFLYLGSFPEDKEISVNRLILLWIGEGFVQDTETHTAEEVAINYVEGLIVKSLVIPVKKRSGGGVKTFRLHELLRDFCLRKAKEVHFFTLLGDAEINLPLEPQDSRRIILSDSGYLAKTIVDFSYHNVRSMIIHGKSDTYEIKKRIGSCDMVLLRVLEVEEGCSEIFKIDDVCGIHLIEISSLIHLRYLAFHLGPWIELNSRFTSSIKKLQNLRILILIQRSGGYKVPKFIWEMVKLRHIHIDQALFEVDSKKLQNSSVLLENLKSLSVARVSYGDSNWLSKLSGLQRLHCLFTIDDPEVKDSADSNDDSKEDDVIEVNDNIEVDDVTEVQSRMLSFSGALISLKVNNTTDRVQRFIGTCQAPASLQKLTLSNFSLESNDISMIGQTLPNLEVFKIYSCEVMSGFEWNVEDDDFPKLKVLKLKDLEICKWFVSEDSFPMLEQLWVEKCDYLDLLPIEFIYLPNLHIISLEKCPPSVNNSARDIEKYQHEECQNTEMRVHIFEKFIRMY